MCFEWDPSFKLVVALMERKVSYVLEKCTFFFKKNCCNISNTFLDPVEQETFRALAYHHHLSKIFKLFNYSKFSTLEVSKFTRVCKVENVPTNSFHFFTRTTYLSFKMIHRVETFNNCSWSLLFIQCSFCFVHL